MNSINSNSKISTVSQDNIEIYFHPNQIKYLERIFPQRVFNHNATEAEMHQYFGMQRVIETIRNKRK